MIFRVNKITISVSYNRENNIWYADVYDQNKCIQKGRRLREGVYSFYSGVVANVDYKGKKQVSQYIDSAEISFTTSCQVRSLGISPCGE